MDSNILPITVLIPTLNRPATIDETINSFSLCHYRPSQIVIVNQTTDEQTINRYKRVVEKYQKTFEIVHIFIENPSSTRSRNVALTYSKNDIVVFSDDDVIVYNDTFLNIFNDFNNNHVSLIAGIDDNYIEKGKASSYFAGTRSFLKRNYGHITHSMLGRFPLHYEDITKTTWAMGFFFAAKKSLIDRWNLKWDEKMTGYAYAEDLDFTMQYCMLSKKEKYLTAFFNNVRVKHLGSLEYRVPTRKAVFLFINNRAYLAKKHNKGLLTFVSMAWTNRIIALTAFFKKQNYCDYKDALRYYRQNKRKVLRGEFDY